MVILPHYLKGRPAPPAPRPSLSSQVFPFFLPSAHPAEIHSVQHLEGHQRTRYQLK